MKEFNQLCEKFEKMDPVSYTSLISGLSADILASLTALTGDPDSALKTLELFLLGAVSADGTLSPEEYVLMYPHFRDLFGDSAEYENVKNMMESFRKENKELKEVVNQMVDWYGCLSEELKENLILVCLMVCAIDGKVSFREKQWIKKLIRE